MQRTPLLTLLGALVLLGCGVPDTKYFGTVQNVKDPMHLRWCNSGEPESLDPVLASTTTSMPLVYALFDGLTDHDLNGLPKPSMATSWDISPDLRRFTFHLRTDPVWSNGRPIDAYDYAYQALRTLHPTFASPNADALDTIKNASEFVGGKLRVMLRDVAPLKAGQVVEVVEVGGIPVDKLSEDERIPNSNLRVASQKLELRDLGAATGASYASVAAGGQVEVLELSGRASSLPSPGGIVWAYVYVARGDGVYGWVPYTELTDGPVITQTLGVRTIDPKRQVGLDLTPEQLAADTAAPSPVVVVKATDMMSLLEGIGVRIPDPHTIIFETTDPTPYFISLTPGRGFRPTPREAVSRSPRRWIKPENMVSSGPMKLIEWKERDYVELAKSESYWDQTKAKLDRITAFSMNDQAASANYYFTGGCDAVAANNIPSSYFPVLNGEKTGKPFADYHKAPMLGIYFALINTEKFNNVHLRRALSRAVDRTGIPRILHGGQIPTAQFSVGTPIADLSESDLALCGVTRDTPGVAMIMITDELCYVPPPGIDFEVAEAKRELDLAKQEMGAAFPKSITYTYNTGVEGHKLIAEYLQQQWQQNLGIPVELATQEWKTFVADTRAGNYQLARFGNVANFPDTEAEFLVNFRCASPDNRPKWCSKEFEAAMDAAKPIADRKARLVEIKRAEKIFLEDVPVIPLYVYTQHTLVRPFVKDLAFNLPNQIPLFSAHLDADWKTSTPAKATSP